MTLKDRQVLSSKGENTTKPSTAGTYGASKIYSRGGNYG